MKKQNQIEKEQELLNEFFKMLHASTSNFEEDKKKNDALKSIAESQGFKWNTKVMILEPDDFELDD